MRSFMLLLVLAHTAGADSAIAAALDYEFTLREPRAAALLGNDFDPRRVKAELEGWTLDVHRNASHEWEMDLGRLRFDCCMESNPIETPIWKNRVLHLRSKPALYACHELGLHEVTVTPHRDGTFDVHVCGRTMKMVNSESYWRRYRRWSRAVAARLMDDPYLFQTLDCETVALDCDQSRLAAACRVPRNYVLIFAPGKEPLLLPPRGAAWGHASRLDFVAEEIDQPPVWCVSTTSSGFP